MVPWSEFEGAEPAFAARVRELLTSRRHLTMATLRQDGSPRISGTEVRFEDGDLVFESMPRAVKAWDLFRDPRVAIHGPTSDPPEGAPARWTGEAKVAGRADAIVREGPSHLFRLLVTEVVVTSLNEAGDRLRVESWHPGRGRSTLERE